MKKLLLLLLLLIPISLFATTYYVSTSGSDGNSGQDTDHPWKTLAYAESHATTAGSVIALKKGDVWSIGSTFPVTHGGNATNDIIWDGGLWGSGANATLSVTHDIDGQYLVTIYNCNYVTFQNIKIDGNGYMAWGFVLGRAGSGNHLTVQDCEIVNLGTAPDYSIAILVSPWRVDMDDIVIQRNTINGITNHGIAFYPVRIDLGGNGSGTTNSYVGYNTITNCGLKGDGVGDCIMIESNEQNTIVEYNVITQGTSDHVKGINFAGGVDGSPDGVIIRYNDVRMRNEQAFYSQNGYSPKGEIYCNLFYGSAVTNAHGTVEIGPWSYTGAYFKFWNNVIIAESSTGAHAFNCASTTSGIVELKNNIFYLTYGDVCCNLNGSGVVHDHNSYYRPQTGDPNYVWNVNTNVKKSQMGTYESTAIVDDPAFVTNFTNLHLQESSPCKNKGTDVGVYYDFDGVAFVNPPNIGAFEGDGPVDGNVTPGSIGTAQSINYNTVPSPLTEITAPTGGTGTYTYQWQSSPNNSTWTNISGATLSGYSPPALVTNTYFRRAVSSGSYPVVYSSPVLITVYANLTPGSIGTAQSIAYSTVPSPLTQITAPTGGTGTYTYQWQSSPDNSSWTNITGATLSGYSPPALLVSTYFRRAVTSGSYPPVYSSPVLITVYADITPGSIGTAQSICYNTAPAPLTQITAPTGGTGTYTYQWQSSPDNSAWTNISGATLSGYSPPALLISTYFRRTVTSGSYPSVYSSPVLITVYANLTSGSIGTAQSVCYNTAPSTLTQLTAPTGGTGTYTYQWQSSANNSTWTNISGATATAYSPPKLTSNMYYRRTVTSGSCGTANTASVMITVRAPITLAQLHDSITISENTSTYFHISISGGNAPYTVNYTLNGVSQPPISNYFSNAGISTGILTTGNYNYVLSSVTDKNGCAAQGLGTGITITVTEVDIQAPNSGTIGTEQFICYNTAPAPLTQLTAPAGGTGTYTYQWQSSPNNSKWDNIPGATQTGYTPPALTTNTYFRRSVTSGSYTVNSSPVLIEVYPQITIAQLHDDIISIFENSSTNFYVDITGGTSPFTINYSLNGEAEPTINGYISGTDISTGVLTAGVYNYTLTSVTDDNLCEAQNLGASITITVTGLISGIPNVFTPNGDGINETWAIPSIHNFPDAVIRIYDRNLKQLIEYTGSDPEWDGRESNGTPLPAGAYLYIIDLNNGTRPIKGYISLVK